ncbi:hypothetical protein LCGC14_2503570 [marine sediment metagenome]|uniref:Uncharacterized protein n=1 Tax=marine sediment metagenome TaxID=412755 RepID=A0A0F9BP51_9ZZZZ
MGNMEIHKITKAEAGYGFSGGFNTRQAGTYGVYRNGVLVGQITGDVAYLASTEWKVEDLETTHPNGCPRTLGYHNTLAAAKEYALRRLA